MSKARSWFLGIGCLLVLLFVAIVGIVALGMREPALPRQMVVSMRLSGGLTERAVEDPFAELAGGTPMSLSDLRSVLIAAAEDDRVEGVRLRIDDFGAGVAQIQELRTLLTRVSAAGKFTSAYMESVGEYRPANWSYYLASAADEISINPLGDVNLLGLSVRTPFIKGTFDKLGIKPEFPGRGAYKTARFMYTEQEFTPEQREMMDWLMSSMMDQLVAGVAEGRGMEPDAVRELVDRGPFLGPAALEEGLVDHLEDWTGFTERIEEKVSGKVEVVGAKRYLDSLRSPSGRHTIAVVTAVGGIMRGENRRELNPLFGGDVMGSDTIARSFRKVRANEAVKAVVFRVDSPGGSALASEVIRREMVRTAEKVPVVVSMGNVAASGGYWISCGAQRIVAQPGTITASIGVFTGHLNASKLYTDKLGITFGKLDYGANANYYGELEDWTDAQRAVTDRFLDRIYDAFLERVAESRDMTVEQVDAIGRGRVYTGDQALERGLVDVLGGFPEAVEEAKKLADIPADARVKLVNYPVQKPLWQQLLHRGSGDDAAVRAALEELDRWLRTGVPPAAPGEVWIAPIIVQ
jgi:protease-4